MSRWLPKKDSPERFLLKEFRRIDARGAHRGHQTKNSGRRKAGPTAASRRSMLGGKVRLTGNLIREGTLLDQKARARMWPALAAIAAELRFHFSAKRRTAPRA